MGQLSSLQNHHEASGHWSTTPFRFLVAFGLFATKSFYHVCLGTFFYFRPLFLPVLEAKHFLSPQELPLQNHLFFPSHSPPVTGLLQGDCQCSTLRAILPSFWSSLLPLPPPPTPVSQCCHDHNHTTWLTLSNSPSHTSTCSSYTSWETLVLFISILQLRKICHRKK